ncbi:hypothetical protein E4T56_gene13460 [Termitomyces sp. T112]|nr:hypothetical protein E4T56_gene13460 [Termitomyces sp. T112]
MRLSSQRKKAMACFAIRYAPKYAFTLTVQTLPFLEYTRASFPSRPRLPSPILKPDEMKTTKQAKWMFIRTMHCFFNNKDRFAPLG